MHRLVHDSVKRIDKDGVDRHPGPKRNSPIKRKPGSRGEERKETELQEQGRGCEIRSVAPGDLSFLFDG
jgi:hypothetical protein